MRNQTTATGAYITVTALFFAWGFITSLVDPLVAAVKTIFDLSNLEAQLSAFAFFIAYGAFSIPAALLLARLRPVRGIVLALAMMVGACAVMLLASNVGAYALVLAGLFVMAAGITVLQVAANPLAASLGPPERSHLRLNLSQAFNSLGTVLGPLVGAGLLLKGLDLPQGEQFGSGARTEALAAINTAFLIIGALILSLAVFIWIMRKRIERAAPPGQALAGIAGTLSQVTSSRWAMLGGAAIFLYVGAEVSIGTQMALFLADPDVWNTPLQQAGYFVSLYWLGAMVGRFAGAGLMIAVPAHRLLTVATAGACLLCLFVFYTGGSAAGYAALAVGIFNSIMFPTIFTLTLERSTAGSEATSGFLCTAIIGGAFVPLAAGAISDSYGYVASFILPAACYAALCLFAIASGRSTINRSDKPEPK